MTASDEHNRVDSMAPRHDEIVKKTADGFTVAWDTTEADDARTKAVERVAKDQATQLGALFGADLVFTKGDEVAVVEIKKGTPTRESPATRTRRR